MEANEAIVIIAYSTVASTSLRLASTTLEAVPERTPTLLSTGTTTLSMASRTLSALPDGAGYGERP